MNVLRKKFSHKGDNGKVLVIGGNEDFHGAPIFAALGAEAAGVDMVRLVVPKSQKILARKWSLNFVVSTFGGEHLVLTDVAAIDKLNTWADATVLGMGLGECKTTFDAVVKIIESFSGNLVLDADALKMAAKVLNPKIVGKREIVVTPHFGEAVEMMSVLDKKFIAPNDTLRERKRMATELARKLGVTVALKGVIDVIVSAQGTSRFNRTGNAGMTVGGTGDVLAGLIAGFMALGLNGFDAAILALRKEGEAGDRLRKKKRFAFTAVEIAREIK